MTPSGRVGVVLKGYPRLSETFIAQELHGLEQVGMNLCLFSMRHPTDKAVHPVHREITAPVSYLPEYLHDEPVRVLRGLARAVIKPGFFAAFRVWLGDLVTDFSRNRVRRFGQAAVLAAEMPADICHLHAHFIHTPASVTHYASLLSRLPWTCSAHAKDIWTSTDRDLTRRLSAARWVVTCTRVGFEHLKRLTPHPGNVHLSYHGLDLKRFAAPDHQDVLRDGSKTGEPVRLMTVCRAVEKKGLDVLIDALARIEPSCHWHWTHIGAGPLIPELQDQARRNGIAGRISWLGAMPQKQVLDEYRKGDLFVLPCRIAGDGDRDGLPNAIVEAQSQRLCCLSTNVSGVPELITDGHNGILVPADDSAALLDALKAVIQNPRERNKMGERGEHRVRQQFSSAASIAHLKQLFEKVLMPVNSLS
ncbi:MAG: glycosyltransferase family 4 protein [Aestuariivirgaceae bacterium]